VVVVREGAEDSGWELPSTLVKLFEHEKLSI
jgi:hypothetical protein